MNVELAYAALEAAKAHRDRFAMDTWHGVPPVWHDVTGWTYTYCETRIDDDTRVPPCGTTGCYAGFITFMTAPAGTIIRGGDLYSSTEKLAANHPFDNAERFASKALDITASQAGILFYLEDIGQVERAIRYLAESPNASQGSISEAAGYADEDVYEG